MKSQVSGCYNISFNYTNQKTIAEMVMALDKHNALGYTYYYFFRQVLQCVKYNTEAQVQSDSKECVQSFVCISVVTVVMQRVYISSMSVVIERVYISSNGEGVYQ